MWMESGVLNLTHSEAVGNAAYGPGAEGGVIDATGTARFELIDTAFVANSAGKSDDGEMLGHGAAVNYDPSDIGSAPAVQGCVFTNNTGLSSFRATQAVHFTCRPGQWAPSTGGLDELAPSGSSEILPEVV